MTLTQHYQKKLAEGDIVYDKEQERAVMALQFVLDALDKQQQSLISTVKRNIKMSLGLSIHPVKGLYLWGGVGRGKTYLMDLFYHALPGDKKERLHFHHFMMLVHSKLKALQGTHDPLKYVAKEFSSLFSVLCFDEFYVKDIADAMLMTNLFKYLFSQGVTLVATSNIHPDNLYHNGLQRTKFLPTISLLKQHTRIIELNHGCDYRLRYLEDADIFHYPLDEAAQNNLYQYFEHLATHNISQSDPIQILERSIQTVLVANNIIWFDFSDICQGPRSQYDYIEIARLYHTVIIGNVKKLNDNFNDVAKRFIMMVDEFYERNVTLIMSLECRIEDLYSGKNLHFEFKRTLSRLQEMKSKEYLSLQHIS
tara:strand:+ start:37419 stop:38516 length:1098 start_codon:yes stop_codon:yes gene_type:complete